MDRTERVKFSWHLYLNYLIHGMAIVVLAQNMNVLGDQWHVSDAKVAMVISSLGIGRLLVLYFSGLLSDKYGRKLFVRMGILTYIPFFIGIVLSPNVYVAYFFGILAGMANSFLDSGTYPALMETFPTNATTANVLIKAFASIGELILPIFVTILEAFNLWHGYSFIFCAAVLALNYLFIRKAKFVEVDVSGIKFKDSKSKLSVVEKVNAVTLTVYGYIAMSTFYLVSQWLTKYGQEALNMNTAHARYLVSIYSMGSIVGVIITTVLTSRHLLKGTHIMFLSTVVSFVTLTTMTAILNPTVILIGSFLVGASAAGGVLQVGLTIMSELFPKRKGMVTGIYYTAGGLSSFTIPVITGFLYNNGVRSIMVFDCVIAVIGVLCSVVVILNTRNKSAIGV
ncbi:MFS transporter [Companilactobacillus mishanensis]|uniref:MFS transporter n=1 Tax=Companilactobacillus mishanensis TaxID=2486008 RepID=A0A5P0ZG44_9LACO|nr:MFS transporter [Companilactobacillus mishanensis]MQS52002.1 MFS transporter [Companilactobacillus mishanensis]